MGWFSNKIDRKQLKPGDHIYSWRTGFIYAHHGIYVGDGKVIQFGPATSQVISGRTSSIFSSFSFSSFSSPSSAISSTSSNHPLGHGVVTCSSLDNFLSGGDLYLYEYGVSFVYYITSRKPTCSTDQSDPSEDVLRRAYSLLQNGFGIYDTLNNNCLDFAVYCKTGKRNVIPLVGW